MRALVLDTNIVLDWLLFADPAALALDQALGSGAWDWIATAPMREELRRVLVYPHLAQRLQRQGISATDLLARFDAGVRTVDVPAKAGVTCKDLDDQKFIDLAVAQQALLLSKDRAVLRMKKRLAVLGAEARSSLP